MKNYVIGMALVLLVSCGIVFASEPNELSVVRLVPSRVETQATKEYNIKNPLPWSDLWKEPESAWVDPNFFSIYKEYEKKDYLVNIQQHWLYYCPIMQIRTPIGGRMSLIQHRPVMPAYIGACDYGDRVGLKSFSVYAKHYTGGIVWPEPPPKRGKLEVISVFMELLFMQEVKP